MAIARGVRRLGDQKWVRSQPVVPDVEDPDVERFLTMLASGSDAEDYQLLMFLNILGECATGRDFLEGLTTTRFATSLLASCFSAKTSTSASKRAAGRDNRPWMRYWEIWAPLRPPPAFLRSARRPAARVGGGGTKWVQGRQALAIADALV